MRFFKKKKGISDENILLNAKNGQIRALQKVIADQLELIETLSSAANQRKEGAFQERLLDLAEGFFLNKKSTPQKASPMSSAPKLETGLNFTDEEIRENLGKVPRGILKRLSKDEDKFKMAVQGQIPTISNESLNKAFEIAQTI